jgi:hypothetical protein
MNAVAIIPTWIGGELGGVSGVAIPAVMVAFD